MHTYNLTGHDYYSQLELLSHRRHTLMILMIRLRTDLLVFRSRILLVTHVLMIRC